MKQNNRQSKAAVKRFDNSDPTTNPVTKTQKIGIVSELTGGGNTEL